MNFSDVNATSSDVESCDEVKFLKILTYKIILPVLVALGIFGNVLNLITLRSPTLQNVPFMYIRAIAVFDLLSLPLVGLACSRLWQTSPKFNYAFTYYQAHIERPLINVMLTASLFTALILTIERYYLICKPHTIRRTVAVNPRLAAKMYIFSCALTSTLLHIPMLFEKIAQCTDEQCSVRDNRRFTPTLLRVSKLTREFVCRVFPVVLLAVLNAIIVRTLQKLKQRRRQMTLKCNTLTNLASHCQTSSTTERTQEITTSPTTPTTTTTTKNKKRSNSYLGSFTEKRLTTMMMAITIIYVVGNVPQSISMILNDDSRGDDFVYQLFRAFANCMEICHHCLNFYIFCLTSRDYSKSFLRNCSYVKRFLIRRLGDRRTSVDVETTSMKPPGELSILLFQEDDFVFLE